MSLKINLQMLLCCCVVLCQGDLVTQWSSWTSCGTSSCIKRTLTCQIGGGATVACRHGNTSVEEELRNCNNCSGTWIDPNDNESCASTCYNSSRWETTTCSTNSSCSRRSRIPCNDLSLCTGNWTTITTTCNASCNAPGIQTASSRCMKNNQLSVECSGSFGLMSYRETKQVCTEEACNTWSDWSVLGSCSHSCGGGSRSRERTCLNNVNCTNPAAEESELEVCNSHQCPTWSDWMTDGNCYKNTQAWTRTCVYQNSLYIGCDGEDQNNFETSIKDCNSTSDTLITAGCDHTLYTLTIPLVVGLAFCFLLLLIVIVCFVYRRKCFQRFDKKKSKRTEKDLGHSDIDTNRTSIDNSINSLCGQRPVSYIVPIRDCDNVNLSDGKSIPSNNNKSDKQYDAVEFHRYASFPGLQSDEEKPEQVTQPKFKPRPSVRRAEQQRRREERRRERKFSKKTDQDLMIWQRTQTMHQPSPNLQNERENNRKSISRHRRTHSEGDIINGDIMPNSASSNEENHTNTIPPDTSLPKFNPPCHNMGPTEAKSCDQLANQNIIPPLIRIPEQVVCVSYDSIDEIEVIKRGRVHSENDLLSPSRRNNSKPPFKPVRANSARRYNATEEFDQDKLCGELIQKPIKPKRNPSFRSTSFDSAMYGGGGTSPNSLHPRSPAVSDFDLSFQSSRSLHNVEEV